MTKESVFLPYHGEAKSSFQHRLAFIQSPTNIEEYDIRIGEILKSDDIFPVYPLDGRPEAVDTLLDGFEVVGDSDGHGEYESVLFNPWIALHIRYRLPSEIVEERIDEPLDCTKIIRHVQEKDVKSVNLEELVAEFNWEPSHAENVMNSLLNARITVIERKDAVKGMIYYFPGLMN